MSNPDSHKGVTPIDHDVVNVPPGHDYKAPPMPIELNDAFIALLEVAGQAVIENPNLMILADAVNECKTLLNKERERRKRR